MQSSSVQRLQRLARHVFSGAASVPVASDGLLLKLLHENPRLRIYEARLPHGCQATVRHEFPTVRWAVLDVAEPTPRPRFFDAGAVAKLGGAAELRELVFEILQEPRFSDAELRQRLAVPVWPTGVGNELMLENRFVRMWDFRSSKHMRKEDFHQHTLDNAFVIVGNGKLHQFKPAADGSPVYVKSIEFQDGQVIWSQVPNGGFSEDGSAANVPKDLHAVENAASTEFREYLIELK